MASTTSFARVCPSRSTIEVFAASGVDTSADASITPADLEQMLIEIRESVSPRASRNGWFSSAGDCERAPSTRSIASVPVRAAEIAELDHQLGVASWSCRAY